MTHAKKRAKLGIEIYYTGFFMKRFAFTLAELLIALTIVGVVAVLTVPSVTKNIYTKSNIVKLEATMKILNDAIKTMMIEERVTNIEDSSLSYSDGNSEEFFTKYLKITKQCDEDIYECFAPSYKYIGSDDESGIVTVTVTGDDALLPNGAAVQFRANYPIFFIDVNGPEPPNVVGRDFFTARVTSDGIVGTASTLSDGEDEPETDAELVEACHSSNNYGADCLYLLERHGWVMDY